MQQNIPSGKRLRNTMGHETPFSCRRFTTQLVTRREYQGDLSEEEEDVDLKDLEKSSAEAPSIRFVNVVLAESIRRRASDMDLGPYERDFRVRHNVDGVLYEVMHPPLRLKNALISRIEIIANLDIS